MSGSSTAPPCDGSVDQQVEVIAATPPTVIDQIAVDSYEAERLQLENERLRAEVDTLQQDREERKKYALRVYCLVVCWLASMMVIVAIQGFKTTFYLFNLSDAVLLALIGGTTASVVGIFLIVATYLFPKRV